MAIVYGPHQVSAYADSDGNYRGITTASSVTQDATGASENLSKNIHAGKRANPLAWMVASYMNLSEDDRVRFDESTSKVGPQKVKAA